MKVTINVSEKSLRNMVKSAGLKIKSKNSFEKLLKSKKFQKNIASDIYQVWQLQNDDAEGDFYDVVKDLFGNAVKAPDDY